MRLELISIPTDGPALDGLAYHPPGVARGGVLIFHGNTTNFYTGPSRFLPPSLVEAGFLVVTFNRRGHDVVTTLPGKLPGGGAYQTAAEGLADNEYAAAYLARAGFERPLIVGHSNGGLLGARFAADHPQTRGLVLLSAHAGGRGTYRRACAAGELGAEREVEALAEARRLVAEGRGRELMLLPGWWYAVSAASLVDRHDHTPDLLEAAAGVRCPSLFLVGEAEDPTVYPAHEFAAVSPGPAEARIVAGADHWYTGVEAQVAAVVTRWLESLDP